MATIRRVVNGKYVDSPASSLGAATVTGQPVDPMDYVSKVEYAPTGAAPVSAEDAAQEAYYDPLEGRFGHDMAWTDEAFQMDPSLIDTTGEQGRDAQLRALDALFGVADSGGYSAAERGKRLQTRMEQEGWLRGQREADLQNLAERGMAGSGAELLSIGQSNQAAAQRMALEDATTSSEGEKRALDALMAAGDIGGSLTTANDNISKLNQNAIMDASSSNVKYLQGAQDKMLERRQKWADETRKLNADIADRKLQTDIAQDKYGWDQGYRQANNNANTFNDARQRFRDAMMGIQNAASSRKLGADERSRQEQSEAIGGLMEGAGNVAQDFAGGAVTGAAGSSKGGGLGASGVFDEDDVFGS